LPLVGNSVLTDAAAARLTVRLTATVGRRTFRHAPRLCDDDQPFIREPFDLRVVFEFETLDGGRRFAGREVERPAAVEREDEQMPGSILDDECHARNLLF
jgi:hypothetical protein